jgi:hypothetical protein
MLDTAAQVPTLLLLLLLLLLLPAGAPASPESSTIAKHKKNAAVGSKTLLKLGRVWLDQADGQEVQEGEEVTLMDWGNAIIKVRWKMMLFIISGCIQIV